MGCGVTKSNQFHKHSRKGNQSDKDSGDLLISTDEFNSSLKSLCSILFIIFVFLLCCPQLSQVSIFVAVTYSKFNISCDQPKNLIKQGFIQDLNAI